MKMVYSVEQDTFIVMSACNQEYLAKYPDLIIQEISLKAYIRDVINRFVRTGSVKKEKSRGRPSRGRPPVSREVVGDLRRLDQNLQTSLTKFLQQPGREIEQWALPNGTQIIFEIKKRVNMCLE